MENQKRVSHRRPTVSGFAWKTLESAFPTSPPGAFFAIKVFQKSRKDKNRSNLRLKAVPALLG
jgi:hypothetical protein